MKEPRDAYKVLQVDPEADLEVIQAAYRRLAQKYHPDRMTAGADGDAAATRMVELNAAWDQLRDAARRSAYDRNRVAPTPTAQPTAAGSPRPAPTESGPTTPGGRPWPGSVTDAPGSAGPPPGNPSGSVLNFGRYSGWSLGEIGRVDASYLDWLDRMPIGRSYRAELDALLRRLGRRLTPDVEAAERRGLFRRR